MVVQIRGSLSEAEFKNMVGSKDSLDKDAASQDLRKFYALCLV